MDRHLKALDQFPASKPSQHKSKKIIFFGVLFCIGLVCAFVGLLYAMSKIEPKRRINNNDRVSRALNYLPDPGPILPGLLKATQHEINDQSDKKTRRAQIIPIKYKNIFEKIQEKLGGRSYEDRSYKERGRDEITPPKLSLRKVHEKLNRPAISRDNSYSAHVLIKIFDEKNQVKAKIEVLSAPGLKDNVRIMSNGKSRTLDNNIEIHVLKNKTLLVPDTLSPYVWDIKVPKEVH